MSRLLLVTLGGLIFANVAAAQCRRPGPPPGFFGPVYQFPPNVWGAPAPAFIPQPPPPSPPAPKPAIKESEEPGIPLIPKKDIPAVPERPKDEAPKAKPKVLIPGEPSAKLLPEPVEAGDPPKTFDQFLVPADAPRAEPAAQVKVGFFNHSARDLVLTVHGEEVKLPGGQFVTLRLPRNFEWNEQGKKAANVTVPNDADGVEIVFRK